MVLSWVRKGLRTGVLSTRYPAVQEQMPEGFRGRPVLDPNHCLLDQGCKTCLESCLPAALRLEEIVHSTDGTSKGSLQLTLDCARCIMCGLCVTACPTDALRMTADYELATGSREDLRFVTLFAPSTSVDGENGKEGYDGRTA